jgi:PIN domain nuclease of toxin-antitoxin system
MRVLLDANVVIWLVTDKPRLSPKALAILEDDDNELFVNRASLWEVSAKTSAGRLDLPGNSIRSVLDDLKLLDVTVLPITDDLILQTETLPWHHADPFDRIVVAQALAEGLTILTADREIPLYDAPVIWK